MTTTQGCHLLIGLPATGKTTFLAAFWYVAKRTPDSRALHVDTLPSNLDYLNRICDAWLKGETQERTIRGRVHRAAMRLLNPETNHSCEAVFPDLSGESFGQHWAQRQWDTDYDTLARTASGVVLFVHPKRKDDSYNIADVARAEAILREHSDRNPEATASGATAQEPAPWDPLKAPTQVMLIDLLQFLVGEPCCHPRLRVCVIVSAWDLVEKQPKTPKQWLKTEMAMLYQFLTSNPQTIEPCVYGVSAQGGDLADDQTRGRLLLEVEPVNRIRVVDADGQASDITAPMRWLIA